MEMNLGVGDEARTERWFADDDAASPGGETGLETRSRRLAALRRFVAEQSYRRIDVSTQCDGAATDQARLTAR